MNEKIAGMNAIVSGSGKVLLLLHGYLSKKEYFQKQIDYFSKWFKVVAIDFLGFNGQKIDYPFSLDDYKNSINRLIDELNVEKLDIIAHSFGSRVVLKMLPENKKIDKIVLTGAAGLKPKKSLKVRFKILKYKVLKRFVKKEKLKNFGSSDYLALDSVMKQSFVKIVNEHLDYRLKLIDNKVLLVFGNNDTETPLYMAKRLKKGLKNSSLYVIDNASHFCFLEKHEEFNIIVKEFLLQ